MLKVRGKYRIVVIGRPGFESVPALQLDIASDHKQRFSPKRYDPASLLYLRIAIESLINFRRRYGGRIGVSHRERERAVVREKTLISLSH